MPLEPPPPPALGPTWSSMRASASIRPGADSPPIVFELTSPTAP
jgi:hypothetical protein